MQRPQIKDVLREKILILDGAMGSLIQQYNLTDADYRGERFKNFPHEVKGNNDLLSITRPDVIKEIHAKYFTAGADIAETNTFSGTSIAMADYHMEDLEAGDLVRLHGQVGDDEAHAGEQLARMPLDLGDDAARLVPGRSLILEVLVKALDLGL